MAAKLISRHKYNMCLYSQCLPLLIEKHNLGIFGDVIENTKFIINR